MKARHNRILQKWPMAVWLFSLPRCCSGWIMFESATAIAHHNKMYLISSSGLGHSRCCSRIMLPTRPALTKRYMSTGRTESTQFLQSNTTSTTASSAWEDEEGQMSDDSWENEEEDSYSDDTSLDLEEVDDENDESTLPLVPTLLEEYQAWAQAIQAASNKLRKKEKSLAIESQKAQTVESTVVRAQLLVSNLYLFPKGTTSAMVPDWDRGGEEIRVTLDPQYDSASAEADALFAQARKVKRGSKILEPMIAETASAIQFLEDTSLDLESARTNEIDIDEGRLNLVKDRLIRSVRQTGLQIPDLQTGRMGGSQHGQQQRSKSKTSRRSNGNAQPELGSPASNVRKLTSPSGCTVWVGRNRRGNEYLSLTLARQNDVWMHSRGCPGAHVIVQNRRGGPTPTEEDFQFAADIAIFYSDLRTEARAPVSAAEPKHLLKPRGAPLGAIKVREEWRTFFGRPDQVPDELKEAREQSGLSDEYRQEDKAKHRRRTRQAAEEEKARRRRKEKN